MGRRDSSLTKVNKKKDEDKGMSTLLYSISSIFHSAVICLFHLLWESVLSDYCNHCNHSQHSKLWFKVLSFQNLIRLLLAKRLIICGGKVVEVLIFISEFAVLNGEKIFSSYLAIIWSWGCRILLPHTILSGCNESLPLLQNGVTPKTQMDSQYELHAFSLMY